MSPIDVKSFEIDRLRNLVRAFGWEFMSSEIDGDLVKVDFVKNAKEIPAAMTQFELDRVRNLALNYAWAVRSSRVEPGKLMVGFSRVIISEK